jgi:CBS domain-containing protein
MTPSQVKVKPQITELAIQAFKTFCDDISDTFGVNVKCEQHEIVDETVAGLEKRFQKLVAVSIIDSWGILNGTFQFIFDQEGLFTLGGIIVMLPEKRITSNRQNASAGLAEIMIDAIGEAGNLLVASWERVFGESLKGHKHFSHRLPAYVGKPWNKPEETIGLSGDEEIFFIPYGMRVGPYPAFKCGVIFPKKIFGKSTDFMPEQTTTIEQNAPKEAETNAQDTQTVTEKTNSKKPRKTKKGNSKKSRPKKPTAKKTSVKKTEAGEITETAKAENTEVDKSTSKQTAAAKKSKGKKTLPQKPETSQQQEQASDDEESAQSINEDQTIITETSDDAGTGKVSEAIRKIAQSSPILPDQPIMAEKVTNSVTDNVFEKRAEDIMQNQVTWASPDDSLEQVLVKMQQTDAGYIMIGRNGVLEGIVSKSDIARAMSPFLQPILARWRRPLDDATLKIRIKWIMSRPVHTIKPETSLIVIVEYMSQFRRRCLAVMDEKGTVQGIVAACDIFRALLNNKSNTCPEDQKAEVLVESTAANWKI